MPHPTQKNAFLHWLCGMPQGRKALEVPWGQKALWLELMTMGWEQGGGLALFRISLDLLMSIFVSRH